jgi:hypothetical protein
MKAFWTSCVAIAALSLPAAAQRVESQKADRQQVLHLRLALGHLTVIEMTEPVSAVAVGSSAFKVEWRENRVIVTPTEPNVSTNLFVWTASNRFNYELEPAGPVAQMDFAVDQPPPDPPPTVSTKPLPKEMSPTEVLMEARPIRVHGLIPDKHQVAVYLRDLFQYDGQLFIRYTVRNDTTKAYSPGIPQVVALDSPHYRESLLALADCQLGPQESSRLKSNGQRNVEMTASRTTLSEIVPGQESIGIVAIKLPEQHEKPTVLRLFFPATSGGAIFATLVI